MNPSTVRKTIQDSLSGQITFPQIVGILMNEGIESYHVDLLRSENRYYPRSGESLVEKVDLPHSPAAQEFSAAQVEAAVRGAQAGRLKYPEFVTAILNAGCVYYIAYLDGKKVSYFGRKGEAHVENFPQK